MKNKTFILTSLTIGIVSLCSVYLLMQLVFWIMLKVWNL